MSVLKDIVKEISTVKDRDEQSAGMCMYACVCVCMYSCMRMYGMHLCVMCVYAPQGHRQ